METQALINLGIMLFILSLISERITNFFKLRFRKDDSNTPKPTNSKTSDDKTLTQKKEKKTLNIALLCGVGTALLVKANLFQMFHSGKTTFDFAWSLEDVHSFSQISYTILGCILTGIFLSFGSKFWHDVLDLLFQMKKLRRKLVDKETYQAKNIEEFDEYMSKSDYDLAKMAIAQNEKTLKATFPNIQDIKVGLIGKQGRSMISIDTSDSKKDVNLPNKLSVELESGRIVEVETAILYDVKKLI